MDLFKDVLSQIKDLQDRLSRLESSNQIQTIVSNGITVLDKYGLNSQQVFDRQAQFNGSAGLTTTNTSWQTVSGSSLAPAVITRNIWVLFYLMGYGHNTDLIASQGTHNMDIGIYDSLSGQIVTNI